MTKEKTENVMISRGDIEDILALYNHIDTMLDNAGEIFDLQLSDLLQLREKAWQLRQLFDFKPQRDEDKPDHPSPWKPCVLKDDDRAWHYSNDS